MKPGHFRAAKDRTCDTKQGKYTVKIPLLQITMPRSRLQALPQGSCTAAAPLPAISKATLPALLATAPRSA